LFSGIPRLIPRLPAQNFLQQGDPGYDANYVATTSHPYPVVFGFNDQPHIPTDPPVNLDNWVKFTVKGVRYIPCEIDGSNCKDAVSQDVQVGLWMYRNGTPVKQTAYWLPELKAALHAVFMTVALIGTEGAVLPLWIQQYLSMVELGKATAATWSTSTENTRSDDGRKMWVASYVIPNPNSLCVLFGKGCNPSTLVTTGDAVYSLWPALYAGPSPDGSHGPYSAAEASLVVEVGLLRGFKASRAVLMMTFVLWDANRLSRSRWCGRSFVLGPWQALLRIRRRTKRLPRTRSDCSCAGGRRQHPGTP
jgi:hypothetical protein